MSGRKRDQRRTREHIVERAFARDRWRCQAAGLVPDVECHGRLDPHERIPRSAWPDGELELDNVVTVCRAHHRWIDTHPEEAWRVGLHGYSWERPA